MEFLDSFYYRYFIQREELFNVSKLLDLNLTCSNLAWSRKDLNLVVQLSNRKPYKYLQTVISHQEASGEGLNAATESVNNSVPQKLLVYLA